MISQENELLNEEKKSSSFEEQINIEKDKFLRLFAEFENYKKRTTKERIELLKLQIKNSCFQFFL